MISRSLPKIKNIKDDAMQFVNRIKWRWILRQKDENNLGMMRPRRLRVPQCTALTDPALECWLSHAMKSIIAAVQTARRRHKNDRSFTNMNGIVRLGFKLLRESQWKAIPNDQNPGYTLEKDEDILQIHEDILKTKEYEEIPICTLNV